MVFTQAIQSSDIKLTKSLINAGALLGDLWMEGHFGVGDPLVNSGESLLSN